MGSGLRVRCAPARLTQGNGSRKGGEYALERYRLHMNLGCSVATFDAALQQQPRVENARVRDRSARSLTCL